MLPALKIGGIYAARVLEIHAAGWIRIALAGETLLARCTAGITEGETVEIEVDRLVPEVVLRIRQSTGNSCRVISPGNAK